MKVSKLTAMDVENCFQLHASVVLVVIITFTSNVQRYPFHFLINLSIPSTQTKVAILENEDLYEVIEEEKQCEELYEKSMKSSIIRLIEVNKAGEATKIEHFSHQHCLVLADKMEEEIDRKCDGPPFSSKASKSVTFAINFVAVPSTILEDIRTCAAKVADIIECKGHQHVLSFDFKYREKCNGCGGWCWRGAFKCEKCRFALDFGCLTLPYSARHKIDEYML
ncbi:hypothetical protein CXB51_015613 [Gossypium anomalum]|uniref:Uncharacterized protein n=1 Tax=Gossypium anomalum TaxID=47600 RepID=A0A8J5YV42_9ROSI|nr:hypothetical protein CXB51_015613 [Gossypium anomalum]